MRFHVSSTVRFGGFAQQGLEFGKDLLDRIEVWAVGRQEEELGAGGANGAAYRLAFVAAEIVDDDDIAGFECWNKNLFDVSQEAFAVDRPIDHAGSINAVVPQRCQEGQRSPTPLRNLGQEFAAARRPAAKSRHVGLRPGLVDEDQARRIKPILILLPLRSPPGHVGPILLGGEQSFF